MLLIAPDILAEARGLSPVLSAFGIVFGASIWLCGWRWHRFWVVISVTVIAGLIGLQTGRSSGGHIMAMGILLAISAGLLAIELARVFAFIAAGSAVWLAASLVFPKGQEFWVAFFIGGLFGVLLYRFWTMLLTSFVGIVFGTHALLCFLEGLFTFYPDEFAVKYALVLNGGVFAFTVLGLIVQSWLERWQNRRDKRRKKAAEEKLKEKILAGAAKSSVPNLLQRLLGAKKKAV